MFPSPIASWLLSAAGLTLLAPVAWAQPDLRKTDPMDAAVSVPPVRYDSPFAHYRAYAEQEVAQWKATNDNAGRIGGWRAYAREARDPASSAQPASPGLKPPPAAADSKPGADSHRPAGHGRHHDSHR
jgi:hypothetical protein